MAATAEMGSSTTTASPWLHGRVPDLLLGAGLLYIGLFVLFALFGPEIRRSQPAYVLPFLVLALSMPHYGGTLLRVYEARKDRRAYAIFTVWISLALAALFVVSVYVPSVGAVLLTIYITWSPWHYTGQNYGITLMFLGRHGIALDPTTKRWIYTSFLFSYAIVFLALHSVAGGAVSYDRFTFEGGAVQFMTLGLPESLAQPALGAVCVAYLVATAGALVRLLRAGSLSQLSPALVLIATQALWFSLPFAVQLSHVETGIEPIDEQREIWDYVQWVAMAHAAQYLWVTSYYAKATPRFGSGLRYGAKVLAAGIAIWTLPALVFAPNVLGRASFDQGLALVVAASVNLHHFVLDGAIWKLRNTSIGEILIRSGRSDDSTGEAQSGHLRRAVWIGCAACVAVAFFAFYQTDVRLPANLDRGQYVSVAENLDRAGWVGRDHAGMRLEIARHFSKNGVPGLAVENYLALVELSPTPMNFDELGRAQRAAGDPRGALHSFRQGLELAPRRPGLLLRAGLAELAVGQPAAAVATLERLLEITPQDRRARRALQAARRAIAAKRGAPPAGEARGQ